MTVYQEASLSEPPIVGVHVAVCAKSNITWQGSLRIFRPSLLRLLCIENGYMPNSDPEARERAGSGACKIVDGTQKR